MKRKVTALSVVFIALCAVILLFSTPFLMAQQPDTESEPASTARITFKGKNQGILLNHEEEVDEPAVYIVQLVDPPLALYEGGIAGLAPTNPAARGETKLDAQTAASRAYLDYLDQERRQTIAAAERRLGRTLEIAYEYAITLNGFAATLAPAEAEQVAQLPGVAVVERETILEIQTDAGPAWIGAPSIWDGSATGGLPGTMGEGIIVGVIDTGVDPWNPSFAATGDDGYAHANPLGAGTYLGVCDPANTSPPAGVVVYDPTFPCNSKLIGAWGYTTSDDSPRDSNGHGSHTASTAAGNIVHNAVISTPTGIFTAPTISGVAPHANLIVYDGCRDEGGCPGSALSAARDQVVLDGVDVVNYSIGSTLPTFDPWFSAEAVSWLAVREAGIFVATSAGNSGPGEETLGAPGDLPWLTTVGANTHNRAFLNAITLDDGTHPTMTIEGRSMTGPSPAPAPVVFAADYAGALGIDPEDARLCADDIFPPGTFSGEIVVCERGEYGRVAKGETVLRGGAGGYVLAQPEAIGGGPGALADDPHVLPAIHITYEGYQALQDYLSSAPGTVNGTIEGTTQDVNDSHADIMGSFSSRGANRSLPDIVVPDVTAPGVGIWAAYAQGAGGDGDYTFNAILGTSMSSPHVAGAAALLKAVHPEWSPSEIQSALMLTASPDLLDDDGVTPATPFARGAGQVDLRQAAETGFVMAVTADEFRDADPALGGDVKTLNLPSLGNEDCLGTCQWTRTISSTLDEPVTYTVTGMGDPGLDLTISPASFTLPPFGTQVLSITAETIGLPVDQWSFGRVVISATAPLTVPAGHMPVAVYYTGVPQIAISPEVLSSTQVPGLNLLQTLTISNTGDGDLMWDANEGAPPLVRDGSFELGSPNPYWDEAASPLPVVICDRFSCTGNQFSFARTGEWWAWFGGTDAAAQATLTQEVEIPVGTAELHFWLWMGVAEGASGTLQVSIDGEAALASFDETDGEEYSGGHSEVVVNIDAYADGGTHTLEFDMEKSGGAIINFFVDDVSIEVEGAESCTAVGDIPWLSFSPHAATTASGESTAVEIIFRSIGLAPGSYEESICLNSNDPVNESIVVPVTLTVEALPSSYGFLAGTINSQGYCDADPAPLRNVTVVAGGDEGGSFAMTTGASGSYAFPLDALNSPYTLTLTHPTHQMQVITGVGVTAQMTETMDVALRALSPCVSAAQTAVEVTVAPNAFSKTVSFALDNSGAGDAHFRVLPDDAGIGSAWEEMAPMPSPRVFNAVVAAGRYVYVIGGESDSEGTETNTTFRYDTQTDSWAQMTPAPAALSNIDGVVINGKIYIPGDGATATTYVYDVVSDSWSEIAAGNGYTARDFYAAVALGSDLYVLGGVKSDTGESTDEVWILDTTSGAWRTGVPMLADRISFSAAAIGNQIYVAGGVGFPGWPPDMTAERFDGSTWTTIADVPDGEGAYTRWSYNADGRGAHGLWLAAGRRDQAWDVLDHAGYYDVINEAWVTSPEVPALNQGRVYMEGATAADGYLYVTGGQNSFGSQVYDDHERLQVGIFSNAESVPWLATTPLTGTITADGNTTLDLTFSGWPTGTTGVYSTTLVISTDDGGNEQLNIPVTLVVEEPVMFLPFIARE